MSEADTDEEEWDDDESGRIAPAEELREEESHTHLIGQRLGGFLGEVRRVLALATLMGNDSASCRWVWDVHHRSVIMIGEARVNDPLNVGLKSGLWG